MKAALNNHRQSPRKVRLVADLIRGKQVEEARQALSFLPKTTAPSMLKLLDSAVANARQSGETAESLYVKTVTVDKGRVQKRYRPFARGRAGTVRKAMSHVKIELASGSTKKSKAKKTVKKTAKKSE